MKKISIEVSDENLGSLIGECEYIVNSSSTKKKDVSSLSYLIDIEMSQSECIKLGLGCEKLISDIIMKYGNVKNIKKKNEKDKKERDHLFMDVEKKSNILCGDKSEYKLRYREVKSNI